MPFSLPFAYDGQYTHEDLGIDLHIPHYEKELHKCKMMLVEQFMSEPMNIGKVMEECKQSLRELHNEDFPYIDYDSGEEECDCDSGIDVLLKKFNECALEVHEEYLQLRLDPENFDDIDCGKCYACVTMTSVCRERLKGYGYRTECKKIDNIFTKL